MSWSFFLPYLILTWSFTWIIFTLFYSTFPLPCMILTLCGPYFILILSILYTILVFFLYLTLPYQYSTSSLLCLRIYPYLVFNLPESDVIVTLHHPYVGFTFYVILTLSLFYSTLTSSLLYSILTLSLPHNLKNFSLQKTALLIVYNINWIFFNDLSISKFTGNWKEFLAKTKLKNTISRIASVYDEWKP